VSAEDAGIVRRWYAAFADDAEFCELTHPEIEWAPIEHNHTIHRGLDGAKRVVAEWSSSWSSYSGHIEEVIDAGEHGTVVVLQVTARGAASGVQIDFRTYHHFKTREGKVVYVYEYGDLTDALKAIGYADQGC
jgi:ketosteroid isomerase-like protein